MGIGRNIPFQKNEFTGGLQTDKIPEELKPNEYLDAQNLRLTDSETDAIEFPTRTMLRSNPQAGRQLKLTNIRGDELLFSLPDLPQWQRQVGCEDGNPVFVTIPAQNNLVIIGYAVVVNELILITTAVGNLNPPSLITPPTTDMQLYVYPPLLVGVGQFLPSVAQIWRIDISDQNATLIVPTVDMSGLGQSDLKYNDYLNHYIAYQVEGEYLIESECLKRLFWTDNLGRPKNLEISTNKFINNIDPQLLDFNPMVRYGNIDFLGYGNGLLNEGVYQYTYRYVTTDGNVTPWFPLSRKVILAGHDNSENYITTDGENIREATTRSIIIRINSVDVNYKTIEVAYAYSIADGSVFEQNIFIRQDISSVITTDCADNSPTTLTFEHQFNEDKFGTILSADELRLPKFVIERAKSIASADKRLHVADFCEPRQVVVDTTNISWSFQVDKNNFALQEWLYSDENESDTLDPLEHKVPVGHNRFSGLVPNTIANPPYNVQSDFLDYKGGHANYYKQGYWRDEYYRFGIVLHFKDGTWGFVDRIWDRANGTDIQFPSLLDYELTRFSNNDWYTQNLGIRFSNIDLSSVAHLIKGFSIVRAKRTDFDKTIRCEGVISPLYKQGGISAGWLDPDEAMPFSNLIIEGLVGAYPNTHPTNDQQTETLWMLSPELDFEKTQIQTGEELETVCVLDGKIIRSATGGDTLFKAYKQDNTVYSGIVGEVLNTKLFDVAENNYIYTNNGERRKVILNKIAPGGTLTDAWIIDRGTAIVQKTGLGISQINPNDAGIYDFTNTPLGPFPYIGSYSYVKAKTNRTRFQVYGGQDATAVANTQWIPTGHYQPVDENNRGTNGQFVYEADVWGGDTFVNFYSRIVSYNTRADDLSFLGGHLGFNAVYFPVQTQINTTLRYDLKDGDGNVIKCVLEKEVTSDDPLYVIMVLHDPDPNQITILTGEAFLQQDVYNLQEQLYFFTGRSVDYLKTIDCGNCFPATIIASAEKTAGEKYNSWTHILVNEQVQLELKYENITHIDSASSNSRQLAFWQSGGAFGFVPVGIQTLNVNNTTKVELGTGELYGQPKYISETVGSRHKWSILRTEEGWYWWDDNNRAIYAYRGGKLQNLSDAGMSNWFLNFANGINNTDNPIYAGGMNLGWDYAHSEVIVSYHPNVLVIDQPYDQWTLCFNESTNRWISYYSFYPRMYITLSGARILTPNPTDLYLAHNIHQLFVSDKHCWFYGTQRGTPDPQDPSFANLDCAYIVYCINTLPMQTKIAGFGLYHMDSVWNRIEIVSNTQYDRYNGAYQLRGGLPMDRFEARGGKWEGFFPLATDKNINDAWLLNSVKPMRIMGEQLFIKLMANLQTVDAQGNTVFDFKYYDINHVLNYFTVDKRNT